MLSYDNSPLADRSKLPKSWTGSVRSALLHVIGLAQYSVAHVRGWAANHSLARLRSKAQFDALYYPPGTLKSESPRVCSILSGFRTGPGTLSSREFKPERPVALCASMELVGEKAEQKSGGRHVSRGGSG